LNIPIIGGFGMTLEDGSRFWTLKNMLENAGHVVRLRECQQTGRPEHRATEADVEWGDSAVVYSYGCSTYWKRKRTLTLGKKRKLVIVAGVADEVPDAEGDVQNKLTLWHAPEEFDSGLCFDVRDPPISSALRNSGAVDCDFRGTIPDLRWVNVRCDGLFPAFLAPGDKHRAIKEHPLVLAAVARYLG
jgi:hypothetical protein